MNRRSQISLCGSLLKYPFRQSAKSASYSFDNATAALSRNVSPPIYRAIPISNFHCLSSLSRLSSWNQFLFHKSIREFSGGSGSSEAEFDQNREVDMINLKFAEAREEIEMAMESKETVYFNEEAECARAAVKEVLDMFDGLLAKLPENGRAALQRSMGLKMEQLKAEIEQLDE